MPQTGEGYEPSSPSTGGDPSVHFEETLSKSVGDLGLTDWAGYLLMPLLGAVFLWFGVQDGALPVIGIGAAVLLVFVAVLYGNHRSGYRVRVTDEGLEIRPFGNLFMETQSLDLPFEAISRVQYNDPDGWMLYLSWEEWEEWGAGAKSFKIEKDPYDQKGVRDDPGSGMFHDGVRIERVDAPPGLRRLPATRRTRRNDRRAVARCRERGDGLDEGPEEAPRRPHQGDRNRKLRPTVFVNSPAETSPWSSSTVGVRSGRQARPRRRLRAHSRARSCSGFPCRSRRTP